MQYDTFIHIFPSF